MARLKRVDCAAPGITRRRRGRGWEYLDEDGRKVDDPEVVARIQALAIPPAWQDVWISAQPMGHIQATGTDAAGRKQYRYHDKWRERRDAEKFESMVRFARELPASARGGGARPGSGTTWAASGSWPAPSGCWTAASSASARRATPRRTRPTGWPRS